MMSARSLSAAIIAAAAGQALGQPTIDGIRDDQFYGTTPIWVQNQPTGFGNNSLMMCDPGAVGSPELVTTGFEYSIPLSALGNPAAAAIKIAGFVNGQGHDFVSNQVVGGMPSATGNLGDPRGVNFQSVSGNQFVSGITTAATPPLLDGLRDPIYGAPLFTQTVRTGFGDASTGQPGTCNGSEIDGLYAVVSGGTLYILVTGNLESNFNKLDLFFDTRAGGQNKLRGDNPDVDFNGLNRMGDAGTGNGLQFDTGFEADFWIGVTGGNQPYQTFCNYAEILTGGGLSAYNGGLGGGYLGSGTSQSSAALTGGFNPFDIRATVDNSNIAGVPGSCPPPAGSPNYANGSEIDAIYGRISDGKLYLLVTGNLQSNESRLMLFFDVQSGGQNQIRSNNPVLDFGNVLNRLGDNLSTAETEGLKFDTGFAADYFVTYKNNDLTPAPDVYSHAAVMRTDGQLTNPGGLPLDYGSYDGGSKTVNNPIPYDGPQIDPQTGATQQLIANYAPRTAGASVIANPTAPIGTPNLLRLTINNSNLAGVSGVDVNDPNATGSVVGAALVTTGVELVIDLPELTDTCTGACASITSVKVAGFISSNNNNSMENDYVSNQVIGGLPNTPGRAYAVNLSQDPAGGPSIDPRLIDFSQIAGNQYVTITTGATSCYANCDHSTLVPILNVNDYTCFLNQYAAGNLAANCDASTLVPVLNVNDFTCFLNKYAAGCTAP